MGDEDNIPKNSSNGAMLLKAENILEKLKCLDYDIEFCSKKGFTPFTRTYFTEPASNAGSQWSGLIAVFTWLVKQTGNDFSVDKYDDPSTSANKMILVLKQVGFQSDFPVSRLKQGWGEAVCNVLDFLADKALKSKKFKFGDPIYPETDGFEEAQVDDDADLGCADIEDEAIESEEEDALYTENSRSEAGEQKRDSEIESKQNSILEASQTPEFQQAWRAEVERVGPRLKQQLPVTGNEWRSHLDQTKKHDEAIQQLLPNCTKQLVQINSDLSQSLEKISSKEKLIAASFEHISKEFQQVQGRLVQVTSQYENTNETVERLSAELSTVSDSLEELKGNMDSRGNSMVDTSPLQKIRAALTKLKGEVKQMELQIGVVGHSLLQASLVPTHSATHLKQKVNGSDQVKSPNRDAMGFSPRSPGIF